MEKMWKAKKKCRKPKIPKQPKSQVYLYLNWRRISLKTKWKLQLLSTAVLFSFWKSMHTVSRKKHLAGKLFESLVDFSRIALNVQCTGKSLQFLACPIFLEWSLENSRAWYWRSSPSKWQLHIPLRITCLPAFGLESFCWHLPHWDGQVDPFMASEVKPRGSAAAIHWQHGDRDFLWWRAMHPLYVADRFRHQKFWPTTTVRKRQRCSTLNEKKHP